MRDMFQAGLLRADTAMKELKALSDETGMFGSITPEEIQAAEGKTYQDVTALRDPIMGLGFETETAGSLTVDYNPYHDPSNGRFTTGGGGGKIGKTKYAPSPQRNHEGIQLKPKTYARLTGVLNTRFPGLNAGEIRTIRNANQQYTVKADGYGGFTTLKIEKIK